jgi:hypothetical protein
MGAHAIGQFMEHFLYSKWFMHVRLQDGQHVVMKTMTRTSISDKDKQEVSILSSRRSERHLPVIGLFWHVL